FWRSEMSWRSRGSSRGRHFTWPQAPTDAQVRGTGRTWPMEANPPSRTALAGWEPIGRRLTQLGIRWSDCTEAHGAQSQVGTVGGTNRADGTVAADDESIDTEKSDGRQHRPSKHPQKRAGPAARGLGVSIGDPK